MLTKKKLLTKWGIYALVMVSFPPWGLRPF